MSNEPSEPQHDSTGSAGHLFPPWSTGVFRAALALGVVLALAVPGALVAWARTPYATGEQDPKPQPLPFDHRHHVRDDGISCGYCHGEARRSARAGMPAASLCMGCHAQIWRDSEALAPLREAYFAGAPLAWQRVTRLPDFVFFDHSIHVAKGVGCAACHGRVDLMAQVYAVQPFTMRFCLECHRKSAPPKRARTDCSVCHR